MEKETQKIEKKILVNNPQGLHARPAALFVQMASKFNSVIKVKKGKEIIDGKSIIGIMSLGAEYKSEIILIAEGSDAQMAIETLEQILIG